MAAPGPLCECVVNVSEGRDPVVLDALAAASGDALLDLHRDGEHHRSVLTLGGPLEQVEESTRRVVSEAVERIDIRTHQGIHPRIGSADVVPFVPLDGDDWSLVLKARDRFADWAGLVLGLPCFLYGPERSLPDIRRSAFKTMWPDTGPVAPHPTAGACAVGIRPPLVAYNLWIAARTAGSAPDHPSSVLTVARAIARSLRAPSIRALGLPVGTGAQVSCNLIDPTPTALVKLFDQVSSAASSSGCDVSRAELVGLIPASVLAGVPRQRWSELDVGTERTIEARLADPGVHARRVTDAP